MTRTRRLIAAAVLALTAACGSTVPLSTGSADVAAGTGGLGLGLGTPAPAGGAVPVVTGAGGVGSESSAGGPGDTVPSPAATQGGAGDSALPIPGAAAKPVLLGYTTVKDAGASAAAAGVQGFSAGDLDAQSKAMATYLNGHGGLLGHMVQLVGYQIDESSYSSSPDQVSQTMCDFFTQDHHVLALMDTVGAGTSVLSDCLAKRHVPLFLADGGEIGVGDRAEFARPYGPFSPDAMPQETYLHALVQRLVADNYFDGWDAKNGSKGSAKAKVGLLYLDTEYYDRYGDIMRKELAAAGHPVVDSVQVPADESGDAAAESAAVLRFRSEGITHVFNANLFFYEVAQTQGFHPRYEIDDHIGPALLAQNFGKSQLHGSMGAGFTPSEEVKNPADPNGAAARCRSIMAAGGQRSTNQTTLQLMYAACDDYLLLQGAVAATGVLDPTAIVRGVEALRARFVPTLTYTATFGPGLHAGASRIRDFAYSDDCGCYQFTGPTLSVS